MVIFRFFKMAAAAILDFRNLKFLTVGTVMRVKLHHYAKFRQNRSNHCLVPYDDTSMETTVRADATLDYIAVGFVAQW